VKSGPVPPQGWEEILDGYSVTWRRKKTGSPMLMFDLDSGDLDIFIKSWRIPQCLPAFQERVRALRWRR
jgi:hypothetical protein